MKIIRMRAMLEALSGGRSLGSILAGDGFTEGGRIGDVPAEALITQSAEETELVIGLLREHEVRLETRLTDMERLIKEVPGRESKWRGRHLGPEKVRAEAQLVTVRKMLAEAYPPEKEDEPGKEE